MATLKEVMDGCFDNIPQNYNSNTSTTGIMRVHRFKNKAYKNGYAWRYQIRQGNKTYGCSSTSLLSLLMKCVAKGYPWVIVDEERAQETLASEGLTVEFIEKVMRKYGEKNRQ